MIGIGIQPAGTTLAGLGAPEELIPLPTPLAGAPHLTLTGDYVIDSKSGDIGRDSSARHRVLLALRTVRKSSNADRNFGMTMPSVMTDTFESEVRAAVTLALTPCTSDGHVRVDNIYVVRSVGSQGRAKITVEFTDMWTQAQDKVTV